LLLSLNGIGATISENRPSSAARMRKQTVSTFFVSGIDVYLMQDLSLLV
jgi:hypothetical protein